MGVPADFGAKINIRKRAVRIDPDVMEDISTKWGNKRDWVSLKVGDVGNKPEEITLNEFFQRNPEFLTTVVNDLVLVRVAVNSEGAGGGMEEIGEEVFYRYLWE